MFERHWIKATSPIEHTMFCFCFVSLFGFFGGEVMHLIYHQISQPPYIKWFNNHLHDLEDKLVKSFIHLEKVFFFSPFLILVLGKLFCCLLSLSHAHTYSSCMLQQNIFSNFFNVDFMQINANHIWTVLFLSSFIFSEFLYLHHCSLVFFLSRFI